MAEATKRILITGVGGLIGSHLAEHLLKKGHTVIGVDNFSIGRKDTVPDGVQLFTNDCHDAKMMDTVFAYNKPDIVYHCAAWAHEGLSQFMPVKITENNYMAHISVLRAAIKHGAEKYIFMSSMSVYGAQKPPFNEDMPTAPEDVYAVSKAASEQTLKILSKVHGIDYVIIRPHNLYGERQILDDPYRNVAAIFINRCLLGKHFFIYGDGEQKRAFTYVTDAIPAIARAMYVSKETINVGPTEEFTINQLGEEILKHFPNNPEPIHMPPRPLEVKDAWCTNNKAERLLGYKTETSFEEGVKKMVLWAKEKGYQTPRYQDLELVTGNVPKTWVDRLI